MTTNKLYNNDCPHCKESGCLATCLDNQLTTEEKSALNDAGIKTQTFWTVQYPDSKEVIAMFKERDWAEAWAWTNCRTGEVEPFEMIIK